MAKKYGAGIIHQDTTPQNETVQANLSPSLVRYDMTERAIAGLNEDGENFKLMSPKMVFVRGFVNWTYANNDEVEFSEIETKIRQQAKAGEVLNGLYVVEFSTTSSIINAVCTVNAELTYLMTDGAALVCTYELDELTKITHIQDKTGYHFQQQQNIINSIIASIKGKKDTITKYKGINEHGLNPSRLYDNDNETGIEFAEANKITFRTTQIDEDVLTDFYNNSDYFGIVTNADGVSFTAKEGGLKVLPVSDEADMTLIEPIRKTGANSFIKKNLLLNILDTVAFNFQAGRNIIFTHLKAWFNTDVELKKKLIDKFGTGGDLGMALYTTQDGVQWRWNRYTQTIQHTPADAFVTTGFSVGFVPRLFKVLKRVHIHVYNAVENPTGTLLTVRVLGLDYYTNIEYTVIDCYLIPGRVEQSFILFDEPTVNFAKYRTQVISAPSNLYRGLTVTLDSIDY